MYEESGNNKSYLEQQYTELQPSLDSCLESIRAVFEQDALPDTSELLGRLDAHSVLIHDIATHYFTGQPDPSVEQIAEFIGGHIEHFFTQTAQAVKPIGLSVKYMPENAAEKTLKISKQLLQTVEDDTGIDIASESTNYILLSYQTLLNMLVHTRFPEPKGITVHLPLQLDSFRAKGFTWYLP